MATPSRQPATPAPRRRWLVALLGVAVASVCVLVGFGIGAYIMLVRQGVINPGWTEANIALSQQRASSIIAALDQYHTDSGVYPDSLEALLHDSLKTIPVPVAGVDHWSYASVNAGQDFVLQFSANRFDDPTAWYESAHQQWFLQDGEGVAAEDD